MSKRLERIDPVFKWENQIFKKLALIFSRAKVTLKQVFDEFDKSRDGNLQKGEFINMIKQVLMSDHHSDFSYDEYECLW